MSNRRKIKTPAPAELPDAVIARIRPDDDPGTATYVAIRASAAAEFAAEEFPDGTVEILGHDALPLMAHNAPYALAGKPPNTVLEIGTAVGGEWETWYADPAAREPVPGSAAWHARKDQMATAQGEAEAQVRRGIMRGARVREPDEVPPAVDAMLRRFEDEALPGGTCPHKHPGRAEVTHWFAAKPDMRFCDRCARPLLPYGPPACDLCGYETSAEVGSYAPDLTIVTVPRGHLLLHMALCERCYPEGASAPRMRGAIR